MPFNPKENITSKPVNQQIFESRMHLSRLLAETGEGDAGLAVGLLDLLHAAPKQLNRSRFQVSMKLRYVHEFEERARV